MEMYLCPLIKNSCCSLFDQLKFYKNWQEETKPMLIDYFKSLSLKLETMKEILEKLFKVDVNLLINQLPTSDEYKEKLRIKFTFLKFQKLPLLFSQLIDKNKELHTYMIAIKSTFYCTICNYENHKFINPLKRTIAL